MQILGYDEQNGQLKVVLSNFGRADFFDVPRSMHEALIGSESKIEYFNGNIWNKGFEHRTYWGNLEVLLKYLENNFYFEPPEVTITSRSPEDDSPLHFACVWGDLGAVNMPLEAGAEPDAAGDVDFTPSISPCPLVS